MNRLNHTVAVIGTGRMGTAIVRLLAGVGESADKKVLWASRRPESLRHRLQELQEEGEAWGARIRAVSHEEALAEADVLIAAMWYADLCDWAVRYRDALAGKILVDPCNPFNAAFDDFTLPYGQSAAEGIQRLLPDTAVVGAFKTNFWRVLERPEFEGQVSDVYVTGDRIEAKEAVLELLRPLPFRMLDAGKLANNRTIERMTLLSRELSLRYGHYPYVAYRLFGQAAEHPPA